MKLSAPLTVNWTLSYDCNFSCSHCYSREQRAVELPLDKVLALADELARCKVAFANFGGGEPLVYKDIFKVAEYCTGLGLKVSMNTNGWLLDREAAEEIARAGFASVGVSLDGATAWVHDNFRNREGSFVRALDALAHLRDVGMPSTVSTVIFRGNVESYQEIIGQAGERGVSTVYLHNFKCSGRGMANREELDLSPEAWHDFYADALSYRQKCPVKLAFDDPIIALLDKNPSKGAVRGSTCGKLSLHIEPDGRATPCGFIPLYLGNILEEGLEKIWAESEVLEKMRTKTPKGKCASCSVYGDCLGGCTARALAVTGSFEEPDPHCWREEA